MTTICAVRKSNRVAISCDTCSSCGASVDRAGYVVNHSKILSVGEYHIALTGPTSAKLAVSTYFEKNGAVSLKSVETIFKVWLELHHFLKETCFLREPNDKDNSYESSDIDALIASPHGIFGVTSHRAVQEYTKFYAFGRGDEYAMGAMFASYDAEDMSADAIARLGVAAGAEFTGTTALPAVVKIIEV